MKRTSRSWCHFKKGGCYCSPLSDSHWSRATQGMWWDHTLPGEIARIPARTMLCRGPVVTTSSQYSERACWRDKDQGLRTPPEVAFAMVSDQKTEDTDGLSQNIHFERIVLSSPRHLPFPSNKPIYRLPTNKLIKQNNKSVSHVNKMSSKGYEIPFHHKAQWPNNSSPSLHYSKFYPSTYVVVVWAFALF